MKVQAIRFNEIVSACREQSDLQLFLTEYGLPEWILEEITENEQAAVDMIINIHRVTHMTPQELIAEAKLNQSSFSRRFGIPLRTVQDWCGGRRNMPEYLKFMCAESLGILNIQRL